MGFDLDWTFLNNDDVVLLRGIVWTSAILSVIGSTFIITSYLMFRRTRDFSMKLIFYLSCCDLGSSLSFILSITTTTLDDDLCKLQGFGIQFFIIASSLWTASIAHSLHTIVTKPTYRVERNEKYYHAMTWGISLFLSLWLFFTNQYGQTPAWCWIGINHDVSRFVFFYMWLIIIFIFNAVTYVRVVRSIKTTVNALMHGTLGGTRSMNQWSNASLQVSKHVSRYLIVYFICWCFSLINRIQNFIDPTKPIFFLYFMHSLLSPLQASLNSLVYGLNKKIRLQWGMKLKQWKRALTGGPDDPSPMVDVFDDDHSYQEMNDES